MIPPYLGPRRRSKLPNSRWRRQVDGFGQAEAARFSRSLPSLSVWNGRTFLLHRDIKRYSSCVLRYRFYIDMPMNKFSFRNYTGSHGSKTARLLVIHKQVIRAYDHPANS